MSTAPPKEPDQQTGRSAGLTLNLSSNNPFRNAAASPLTGAFNKTTSPTSPFDDPPPRPVSRNPFLDPAYSSSQPNLTSPASMSVKPDAKASSPTAEELFDTLTIDDKKPARPPGAMPPVNRPPGPPGRENVPPGRRGPPPGHRPSRSQEEAMRARRMQGGGPRPGGPSGSPHRRPDRRPRRNSDSSVMDSEKPLTEEEKKARDARRRDRERRHRQAKDQPKKGRKLDIIDQLDATSIFGTGLFHHDGPFDALNPHRNRQGSRRAPMQAFPKDSLNNTIGGSGPLNARPDHSTFLGNADEEAFKEYSNGAKNTNGYNYPAQPRSEMPVWDPTTRGSILHGDESMGLGTSTFLEGTPAARAAIQKREAEQVETLAADNLQRKKSLAQRIRSINKGPREFGPSGRMTNPEGVYASRRSPDAMPPATSHATGERNPFFSEYSKEPESISVRRPGAMSPTSPPPPVPRRGSETGGTLERRATSDATSPTEEVPSKSSGGGLLARVKSLKGGRRRQPSDAALTPVPGTAV